MILPLIAFGFMRISMSYFYAQKRNLFANIITYGEPIIVAAVVFTLPAALGLTGIWLSAPVSQVSLALLALGFLLFLLKNCLLYTSCSTRRKSTVPNSSKPSPNRATS